jgi:nickel transport system permease protein
MKTLAQIPFPNTVFAALRRERMPGPSILLSAAIIILLVILSVAAPLISPHDPNAIDLAQRLQGMSLGHPVGTDHLGRDILSRLIYGTRVSLGAVAVILAMVLVLGIGVGSLAGYAGGRIDAVIMRFCDVFLTFPTFVLAMFMVGVLGTGIVNVVLAIALSHWAWYARIARSLVLSFKERDFVLAARVAGGSRLGVFFAHILPSVFVQFVVLCTLDIGHMILHIAGLSFLGLGVMPPMAEWGVMISDAREFIWTQPMLLFWPGLMVFCTVMAFNQLGDALRDRLDPALRAEAI